MLRKSQSDKAVKTSLSLPDSLLKKSKLVASERFGGNFSAFIQSLVEAYVQCENQQIPSASDPAALVRLFKQFLPSAESTARNWTETHRLAEPLFISRLLLKLNELQMAGLSPDSILRKMTLGEDEMSELKVAESSSDD